MDGRAMVLEFLRHHQLDIMLFLSGVCAVTAFFVAVSKNIVASRRYPLLLLELCSAALLMADRFAYVYRGDPSVVGFWAVRVSNFLVFFLTLAIIYAINMYAVDVYVHEGGYAKPPRRLMAAQKMLIVGMVLVVVSQFTGLYYTFDATNTYTRAPGFLVCYAVPIATLALQLLVFLSNRKQIRDTVLYPLEAVTLTALVASMLQGFAYGVSLTNLTLPLASVMLYAFAIRDFNEQMEQARQLEIEYLRMEKNEANLMLLQTATALATAIDAKDAYTQGHSTRVASYAKRIAELAGKSEEYCMEVYFAGLLHDVGKIGIPDAIINKDGRLTDEEFAVIRTHPEVGSHILEGVTKSPFIRIGARSHHERYDGTGYPDHLAGEQIPELARIIAVADAYDAMTSIRSYRGVMSQEAVRKQMEQGLGTQFDPEFGRIMLYMIDADSNYLMREGGNV